MQIRKTIGVRLHEDELTALRAIADREDRDVRRQAARIIRASLIEDGALTESTDANGAEPRSAVPA